jgi:3-dehydroquinate synthase
VETINLDLGDDSYPIYIGSSLLADPMLITSHIRGRQVLIVSNDTVGPLYADKLAESLPDLKVDRYLISDGEQFKNLATLDQLVSHLIDNGHTRDTTIIALGGGVVGDTAGFTAATYQRGVDFIQVPTTLLSQVDASVGGKTAVNHPLGKNMIGAFYQPNAVVIDTDTLQTLPKRQLIAGIAEIIKHGVLGDLDYFEWLEENLDAMLALDTDVLTQAVRRSCEIKSEIVSADEKETGQRALLNLGHTFGHAIETAMGYGQWLHGEAVGTGLVMAADLSVRLAMLDVSEAARIKHLVARAGLPVEPPAAVGNEMFELMARDKKASDQGLRLVLLEAIGQAEIVTGVEEQAIKTTLAAGERLAV